MFYLFISYQIMDYFSSCIKHVCLQLQREKDEVESADSEEEEEGRAEKEGCI